MSATDLRLAPAQLVFYAALIAMLAACAFFITWTSEEGVSTRTPTTDGPWPFQVHNTDGLGLKVRSCAVIDCGCRGATCAQLGRALDGETLWAECRATTGFDPVGDGDRWLRVRWSNGIGGVTDVGVSAHQAEHVGWVYEGYARPLGHNGSIATCDEDGTPQPTSE